MKLKNPLQDSNQRISKNRDTWRSANAAPGSHKRKLPLVLALAVMLLAANSAKATIIIDASEVGGGVVFTLSGTLDLASLQLIESGVIVPGIDSISGSGLFFGSDPTSPVSYYGATFTGPYPTTFGSGNIQFSLSSGPGSIFGFGPSPGVAFNVADSYISGTTLANSMTFLGTFTSLGLSTGTYEWNWSNGSASDSLILQIGSASVPEAGSTLTLLVIGGGGLLAVHRWRGLGV